jgi:hypothetical protein
MNPDITKISVSGVPGGTTAESFVAYQRHEQSCINCAHWSHAYRTAFCDACRDHARWEPSKSGRRPMGFDAVHQDKANNGVTGAGGVP